MTYPTPEEIKQIAIECGAWIDARRHNYTQFEGGDLQTFATRMIEVGRKMQRESDAMICDEEADIANNQARNGGSALDDGRAIGAEACAEAIRNNTGE